ncbi:MAG TPA: Gfo/Idh/MocA family oxidoreductase [Candidatus Hydrogenedentes bacterium]|nr:Gfo/Idh/MocA family oxidoreductase [Candidatus Hydrogenedentota bacterium]
MIRVGFVGLGHNALAHIEAHRAVGLSEIVALCDRNPERLAAAAEQFGVAHTYGSAEELCADRGVDAVSVNTGDPYHAEPFVAAVSSGKHVFVEKPVANSLEQLDAMAAAAREAAPARKLAAGYILRFNPVFEAVHALCRQGKLGEVYYLEGDYVHNLLYQAAQVDGLTGRNWYLEQERPLVGGGSHPLDLLRWFSGQEVVEVTGFSTGVAFPAMAEDDCQVALFRFDGGAVAKVAAVYAPRMDMAPFYNLRVYGTRGTVERDTVALAADAADCHPAFAPIEAQRVGGHPYEPEVRDWLEAILDDRAPRCDFFDGANSTAATLVACEAIAQGRTLPVKVYRRVRTE